MGTPVSQGVNQPPKYIYLPSAAQTPSPTIKLLFYRGPGIDSSAADHLQQFISDSGIKFGHVRCENPSSPAWVLALMQILRLSPGGHAIFNLHGLINGQHLVKAGMYPGHPLDSTLNVLSSLQYQTHALTMAPAVSDRPSFHFISCGIGSFRNELIPGSIQWKSSWVFLYSGKRMVSCTEQQMQALKSGIRYLRLCDRQERRADPVKFFILAGLRRGDCMTLLGGDLEGPVTWHAPKDLADLETPERVAELLDAHPKDLARFAKAMRDLTDEEIHLLPPVEDSLEDILFSRVAHKDHIGVGNIIATRPDFAKMRALCKLNLLLLAVIVHHPGMVDLLLRSGAHEIPKDTVINSPFIYSLTMGILPGKIASMIKIMELFINYGSDPNECNTSGAPALICAIQANRADAVEVLLAHQARPDATFEDKSALQFAIDGGNTKIINLLKARGAS
jgi:hypothetical protein